MRTRELLTKLFVGRKSPYSPTETSLKMGRGRGFIARYVYDKKRDSVPNTDLLAEILDVIGWDLLTRNRSTKEEIIIDPPKNE